jgi:hypothetical protein
MMVKYGANGAESAPKADPISVIQTRPPQSHIFNPSNSAAKIAPGNSPPIGFFEWRKEVNMEKQRKSTYERPTLVLVGSFKVTGLGVVRGPERVIPLRFSL